MKTLVRVLVVLALGAFLDLVGGCASQVILQQEFYEPSDATKVVREDGLTVGALKSETKKSGQPDWSGNKSFNILSLGW